MTIDQLIELERISGRAIMAAKVFAKVDDALVLNELSRVIAELRHAGLTLCDPAATEEAQLQASVRLHSLFSHA